MSITTKPLATSATTSPTPRTTPAKRATTPPAFNGIEELIRIRATQAASPAVRARCAELRRQGRSPNGIFFYVTAFGVPQKTIVQTLRAKMPVNLLFDACIGATPDKSATPTPAQPAPTLWEQYRLLQKTDAGMATIFYRNHQHALENC